ncbi:MAG: tRNA threonylcarbamoyladenosine dehydratase [Ruminococcaceae bacterium]|nr:tRNA threonylcarbamoyladenosine dehydratase [Oscillospiraceae bacterium]
MIKEELSRLAMVLGENNTEKLKNSHVAVFGVGGVGGHICEALARCGVGHIDIFDNDVVSLSNINRQIIALHSTVGRKKVDVMAERLLDINPELDIKTHDVFYSAENADSFPLTSYDYIADAIDSVPSKLELIKRAKESGVEIISSMGTGNKLDPARLEIADIQKTEYCPLAKTVRVALRKIGINHLTVVFSKEEPVKTGECVPGSTAFVPAAAGLLIASKIIRDIACDKAF